MAKERRGIHLMQERPRFHPNGGSRVAGRSGINDATSTAYSANRAAKWVMRRNLRRPVHKLVPGEPLAALLPGCRSTNWVEKMNFSRHDTPILVLLWLPTMLGRRDWAHNPLQRDLQNTLSSRVVDSGRPCNARSTVPMGNDLASSVQSGDNRVRSISHCGTPALSQN